MSKELNEGISVLIPCVLLLDPGLHLASEFSLIVTLIVGLTLDAPNTNLSIDFHVPFQILQISHPTYSLIYAHTHHHQKQ